MKKQKKHNPRSEAAQRGAIKLWNGGQWKVSRHFAPPHEVHYRVDEYGGDEVIAVFDLRDCYRKRQPLKGITKAVRKAVQPRRKK